jgi:hypothetical protein
VFGTRSLTAATTREPECLRDNVSDIPYQLVRPSWAKNTNGLLREYFPKGTEITGDIRYLQAVADEINDRPRAILGFRTPAEVFAELLLADNPEDNLSLIASTG